MKGNVLIGSGLLALALAPGALPGAEPPTPWLHVRVEEPGRSSRVHVNLPLPVVEVALKAAPQALESHGRIFGHDGKGFTVSDFRRIWGELKKAGDTELVSVEDQDENVRVARRGAVVEVKIDRKGKEAVKVEVPLEVVDALLSGEGEELNVRAALSQLQKRRGDIVRVNDETSTVRIWIDEQS